jgi:hypothetical protein
MIHVKIVNYNKNKLDTFEEQINKVLDEMEENKTIKDIKVLSNDKVLIIYTINKLIRKKLITIPMKKCSKVNCSEVNSTLMKLTVLHINN